MERPEASVTDNPRLSRYELWLAGQRVGVASYQRRGPDVVFVHTEIDEGHEGAGLGGTLARGALDDVVRQGGTIVPVCPFITAYLRRHPRYLEHVDADHRARIAAG